MPSSPCGRRVLDPDSSPTRRSSDRVGAEVGLTVPRARRTDGDEERREDAVDQPAIDADADETDLEPQVMVAPFESVGRVLAGLVRGDRKSTRLNSSHLVISYAVFSLRQTRPRPRLFPYPTLFRSRRCRGRPHGTARATHGWR